jgi:hypothetical protein
MQHIYYNVHTPIPIPTSPAPAIYNVPTHYDGAPLSRGNALPAPFTRGGVGEIGEGDGDPPNETYGRGAGAGAHAGEDGTSSYGPAWMPASIPNASMMPRGGERSTIASRSCGVVSLRVWERRGNGSYLASKVLTRAFPLHLFRTEQHRALAEYLALFLDPAL